jgi:hypothetical protein
MLTMCGRLILDADSLELTNHFHLDKARDIKVIHFVVLADPTLAWSKPRT